MAKKKSRRGQDPLTPFYPEIMEKVIRPRIEGCIHNIDGEFSIRRLHDEFREEYGSAVSAPKFKTWLEMCGFEVRRATQLIDTSPAPSDQEDDLEALTAALNASNE